MNKTWLIFRHEFLHTIRKRGFVIITLAIPVLALAAIGIFQIIAQTGQPAVIETTSIGYVDDLGGFDQDTGQGNIQLVGFDTYSKARTALLNEAVAEFFIIPPDFISSGVIERYTLAKQVETPATVSTAIRNFLVANMLSGKVPEEITSRIQAPLEMEVTRLTETGEVATDQGGYGNVIIPAVFSLLLALSLMLSSTYMIQGLGDEKESRLVEVLLSSVSGRQLLLGKVLGLGTAGLLQVVVWLASAPLLLRLASSSFGGFFDSIQIPANFLVLGIVYFILGYLLFASLSVGVGAISPNAREGQQLAMIYTLLTFVPLWFSSLLFIFPESAIWKVLTIFPITAPIATMLRLGVSDIASWELIASIAVLVLSTVGVLFMTVRAFNAYLLMYGKRPGWREIMRNIRTA